jgi:hypothetical protein
MRNNWVRSALGMPAVVKIPKTRVASCSIIGAIHSSSVFCVVLKKTPPIHATETAAKKKKKKGNSRKKRAAAKINGNEATPEDDATVTDVKPVAKGTTDTHFIKFISELLNIMD